MSRIGKKIIEIPQGVEVKIVSDTVIVKGPKGELSQKIHPLVKVAINDGKITLTVSDPEDKANKSLWGLFNRLINNMVLGVTVGFEKSLKYLA